MYTFVIVAVLIGCAVAQHHGHHDNHLHLHDCHHGTCTGTCHDGSQEMCAHVLNKCICPDVITKRAAHKTCTSVADCAGWSCPHNVTEACNNGHCGCQHHHNSCTDSDLTRCTITCASGYYCKHHHGHQHGHCDCNP